MYFFNCACDAGKYIYYYYYYCYYISHDQGRMARGLVNGSVFLSPHSCFIDQALAYAGQSCTQLYWGRIVFETRAGCERFDFSCWPPNNISDTPIPPCARAQGSWRTAEQRDAKRRTSARKREREKRIRTAWAKERKKRAKAVSGPALADTGATAAAPTAAAAAATATAATAASRKSATAAPKAATAPQAAVAATYCEAAMATLPTAAAPRAAAEAATRRTRRLSGWGPFRSSTAMSPWVRKRRRYRLRLRRRHLQRCLRFQQRCLHTVIQPLSKTYVLHARPLLSSTMSAVYV